MLQRLGGPAPLPPVFKSGMSPAEPWPGDLGRRMGQWWLDPWRGAGRRSGRAWHLNTCRTQEVAFGFWTEGLSPVGSQARPDFCFSLFPFSSFSGTCQTGPSPHSPAGSQQVHGRGGVGNRGCSQGPQSRAPSLTPFLQKGSRLHCCGPLSRPTLPFGSTSRRSMAERRGEKQK